MICGIDVGGTKALGIVTDASGVVIAQARRPTPPSGLALVDTIADLVGELATHGDPIGAVGLGVAGIVTADTVRYSPNMPGVVEYPIRAELSERLGIPVILENDANAMAVAEHRIGAAQGVDDVLLAALGTGIGTSFILGGGLYRGAHGFAGESGHMVVDAHGPTHHTGQRGPWEYYASGTSFGVLAERLVAEGQLPYDEGVAGKALSVDLASSEPTPAALNALQHFAGKVALGLRNLVYVLDPALIVLSGGLVEIGDRLRRSVEEAVDAELLGRDHRPVVPVALAALGVPAGAQGAAILAADSLLG